MSSVAQRRSPGIIFVTGTDTGVGKTLFTGLLLHHLRATGRRALAMKPFCSGGRADVKLLAALQDDELTAEEINPFYFPEPVAPVVSLRRRHRTIPLAEVLRRIHAIARRCDWLLVEGSGGLLVPLGEKYCVIDMIRALNCRVVVVARNRLGTINHTLLTIAALRHARIERIRVALMDGEGSDASAATNRTVLAGFLAPVQVDEIEFLGENANETEAVEENYKKLKKTLARFCR